MTTDNILEMNKTALENAVAIAKKGTHCGMCKFDFMEQVFVQQEKNMVI